MKVTKEMFSSKNLYTGFLHFAVIALAIQVVVLARQNDELKNPANNTPKEQLKEGDYFYFGELTSIREGEVPDTNKSKQLVFVFTTRCPFCKESLPLWKQLADENKTQRSVVGISLDPIESTTTYLTDNNIDFPVFVPKNYEWFVKQIKNTAVPKTIIRNNKGVIEKSILGRLNKEQLSEINLMALATPN